MTRQRAANDPAVRRALSDRQRQVLDLIVEGRTNGEIAERLGITLDGVKWHVREILGRLGVDSREDAAEWWRRNRGWHRPGWTAAFAFPLAWQVGAAVAAVAVAVAAAVLVVAAGGEPEPAPEASTPGPVPPSPSPSPQPAATAVPAPLRQQPPLVEVAAGTAWRLSRADDGLGLPHARDAVLAIHWNRQTPLIDVLDGDGRVAIRLETGYGPMARLDPVRNRLLVSDWPHTDSMEDRTRILVFDLGTLALTGEVELEQRRVNYTVFFNALAVSEDGSWLYWVEHDMSNIPTVCEDRWGQCDRTVVHAIDLGTGRHAPLAAAMPRGCLAYQMTPGSSSAVVVECGGGGGRYLVEAASPGAMQDLPGDAGPRAGWYIRDAGGVAIQLRVGISAVGDVTGMAVLDRATGRTMLDRALTDVWSVELLDGTDALILRPSGRLERMNVWTGAAVELPYAIEAGSQGLDVMLVR